MARFNHLSVGDDMNNGHRGSLVPCPTIVHHSLFGLTCGAV